VVRAKVELNRAVELEVAPAEREEARREAAAYFRLAASYTLPPSVVVVGGLPASGKTHAARALGELVGASPTRSDVVRKSLLGREPGDHWEGALDAGPYTPEVSEQVYAELLRLLREQVAGGRSVVLDAAFLSRARRAPFLEAIEQLGAPAAWVCLRTDEAVIRERLERRAGDRTEVSDADWKVYVHLRDRAEPPDEIPDRFRVDADGAGDPAGLLDTVLHQLMAQVPEARIHSS
jgi:predicted kinase